MKTVTAKAGEPGDKVQIFKEHLEKQVIKPLKKFSKRKEETGKEFMLIMPPQLDTNIESEIVLIMDNFPYYKSTPYKVVKRLMNERKILLKDGIYNPSALTFDKITPPERVIFFDFLPNKKGLRCFVFKYVKGMRSPYLFNRTFKTPFSLADPKRVRLVNYYIVTRRGCGNTKHDAYEIARLNIKMQFVEACFPSWIEAKRTKFSNHFFQEVKEKLFGITPPGIEYTAENKTPFFKEEGMWCVWVEGRLKQKDFDAWVKSARGK